MRIVFDMDGTLADNSAREHLAVIAAGPFDSQSEKNAAWEAFHAGIPADKPIVPIVNTLRALVSNWRFKIEIWTARPERYREVTAEWCRRWGIVYDVLRMRPDGDWRKSYELKLAWHAKTPADLVFEDHPETVKRFREVGVVVAQVADRKL